MPRHSSDTLPVSKANVLKTKKNDDLVEVAENELTSTTRKLSKKKRLPNNYLKLGVQTTYVKLKDEITNSKKKKSRLNAKKKAVMTLSADTTSVICDLLDFVVRQIADSAVKCTRARKHKTIMPADIYYAMSNKFMILSSLVHQSVNAKRKNFREQLGTKISKANEKASSDSAKSAPIICHELDLNFRSVFSDSVLRKADDSLKVSRDSIIALTVFIHYFARYIVFSSLQNQMKEGTTRLRVKHVQHAIRSDECLSCHFGDVHMLGGHHYSNVYGKIKDSDQLCMNKKRK